MSMSPLRVFLLPLVLLLLSPLFLRLGVWQLHRADEDASLAATIEQRTALPPARLVGATSSSLLYRNVIVRGRFEPGKRVLLDNRTQDGVLGYHLIVPFHIAGTDLRVLVNRGWIPHGARMRKFAQSAEVSGRLVRAAVPFLRLHSGRLPRRPNQPRIEPYVDPAEFAKTFGYPVLPFLLVEDSRLAGDALELARSRANRRAMHIGYAVQWFAFAALAALFSIILFGRGKAAR